MTPNEKILVSTMSLLNPEDEDEVLKNGYGLEIFSEELSWSEEDVLIPRATFSLSRYREISTPVSIHAPFFDLNLASEKFPAIRKLTLRTYRDWLRLGKFLGCIYVAVHPHGSAVVGNKKRVQRFAEEGLIILAEEANNNGLLLAVENVGVGPTQLFNQEEYVQLIKEIPGLYALLDVGHAFLNGWNITAVIRKLGDRLLSLHLHDNGGWLDDHFPVGAGQIDWPPIWEELNLLPNPPYLVLEYFKTPVQYILSDARRITGLTARHLPAAVAT
ncbi:MAG: sugar phosphate isomerase/epimerase [Firmicutes bacterium]|nr:sugar phosphate isomerase/epimerase [Bacillota bacterium]